MPGAVVAAVTPSRCGGMPRARVRARHGPASLGGVGEADRTPGPALERPVHRPGVAHEVRAGPRAPGEELVGEHVALESIAASARRHEVADRVCPSPRERVDMIERRLLQREMLGTIHASSTAIAECGVLQGTFRVARVRCVLACVPGTAATGRARANHPENPTSRHRTSPEKTTPRPGLAGAGCREWRGGEAASRDRYRGMDGSRSA